MSSSLVRRTRLSIRPALALALVSAALAAVQVAAAPSAVAAPGPDPASVERTLAPGAVSSFPVIVGTPTVAPNPDIVFLADTTGSMDPALANVRNHIRAIMSDVQAAQPNARFGVAEYKEQADGPRVFRVNTNLTNDNDVVADGTQQWLYDVGGGGAPWTDFINAHYQIATGAFGFRPAGTKIVAWFGDAQSHDPSLGHTLADTNSALRASGIRVVAVPVLGSSAPGLDALGQATSITSAAQGVLMPNAPADQVANALLDGIRALDVAVQPTPSCDPQLSLSSEPATRTVRSGTDAAFTETVTVADDAAPDTYTCTVDFRVGGISAGYTQTVTVHVPGAEGPTVSIGDVSVPEGDSGTTPAIFTVSLDQVSDEPVTVQWSTRDGTATAPDDFMAANGQLTLAPGEVAREVTVGVIGDRVREQDETFTVDLSNASGATLADRSGVGTIVDDDDPGAVPGVRIGDVSVPEGDSGTRPAAFTLSLDEVSAEPVTVEWSTGDGTATAPDDYAAASDAVTFAPGEVSKQVTVAVQGDTQQESDESFTVDLSNASGASIADDSGLGVILDDDDEAPPAVGVDDASTAEGDAGTTPMEFTVRLDRAAGDPVTVQWATADGTAAAPDDFVAASGEVTFAPGAVSRSVTVQVRGDTVEESDETFRVDLSDPTGAVIGDGSAAGTILNDDDDSPVNHPPVAADDSYAIAAGSSLSIDAPGVLSNDTDPDDDALHALHQAGPYHGTLTLDDDGSFTYAPTPGYVGTDTFTYRAYDGSLVSAPATVTIHTREYRVDAMIRAGGPYIGDDVYNASAVQQRAGRFAQRGATATYSVRIENDSTSAPDSFRVAGSLAGRGFTVGYFDGGRDVTSEVLAGTWTTPTLQPGQAHVLTVHVDVARNAPLLGNSTSLINVSSTGDPSIVDAVETATWTL